MLHYVYTMFSQPATLSGYAVRQRLSQARSELGSLSPVTPSVCPVLLFVHRFFPLLGFVVLSQFLDWGLEVLCGMTSGCRLSQTPSTRLRPCRLHDGNYIGQPGEFIAWNSAKVRT